MEIACFRLEGHEMAGPTQNRDYTPKLMNAAVLRYISPMDMHAVMSGEMHATIERQARTIAALEAKLAQCRTCLRFLYDDAEYPADVHGLAARIRNDVPRLLDDEIGPDGETTIA